MDELDGPFFWSMPWEMWSEVDLMHFTHQKKLWAPESQFGIQKGPISVSYELNWSIWTL